MYEHDYCSACSALPFIPFKYRIAGRNIDIHLEEDYPAEEMPQETKTRIDVSKDGRFRIAYYEDGELADWEYMFAGIADMEIKNGNTLIVTFNDGTCEKATLQENDGAFNLEYAISICMMKKLCSAMYCGEGSQVYNKLVDVGIRKWKEIQKKRAKAEKEAKAEQHRMEKRIEKTKKRKEKREARMKAAKEAEKERQIEIQKEAYLRAMREFQMENNK